MNTRYINSNYRVTMMEDGSLQYDKLTNGKWMLFSFEMANDCHSETDANNWLGNS